MGLNKAPDMEADRALFVGWKSAAPSDIYSRDNL